MNVSSISTRKSTVKNTISTKLREIGSKLVAGATIMFTSDENIDTDVAVEATSTVGVAAYYTTVAVLSVSISAALVATSVVISGVVSTPLLVACAMMLGLDMYTASNKMGRLVTAVRTYVRGVASNERCNINRYNNYSNEMSDLKARFNRSGKLLLTA
jgi:hypothetical protein